MAVIFVAIVAGFCIIGEFAIAAVVGLAFLVITVPTIKEKQ